MSRAEKKELRVKEVGAYRSWRNMRDRCGNLNREKAYNYAGKGITCCARWGSFELFLEDMGSRPEGFTLERRDSSKGYEPANCRWATTIEQNRNTTQNVINFETAVQIAELRLAGVAHTEIGRRFGVNKNVSRSIMRGRCWADALIVAKERSASNVE